MSSAAKGTERIVTMRCALCKKPFGQLAGFVTTQACTPCIALLAAAFWKIWEKGKGSG